MAELPSERFFDVLGEDDALPDALFEALATLLLVNQSRRATRKGRAEDYAAREDREPARDP